MITYLRNFINQQGNDPFLAEQRSAHAERVLCFCGICNFSTNPKKQARNRPFYRLLRAFLKLFKLPAEKLIIPVKA